MAGYMTQEHSRAQAVGHQREIEKMNGYLVPKDEVDISKIKVWSQIAENFTSEDVSRIR